MAAVPYNNLTVNHAGTTFSLGGGTTATGACTITSGTLDATASNYNLSCGTWSNSGTFTPRSGMLTLTRTGTFSDPTSFYNLAINGSGQTVTLGVNITVSNNLTITAGTLDDSTSNYAIAVGGNWTNGGAFTARSGTVTLNGSSQTLSGATTFYNLTLTGPQTVTFPAATTTINNTFTCTGSSGNIITINSSSPSTQAILSKPSGTVQCDYLNLTDSAATGGVAWNAGADSTNGEDNTGWVFRGASNVPLLSNFSPVTGAIIHTATPNISFTADENATCYASTTNAGYSTMSTSGTACTGAGSTAGECAMPSLGSSGSKTIYFACQDSFGNANTSSNTQSVTYTLQMSLGNSAQLIWKGSSVLSGGWVFR